MSGTDTITSTLTEAQQSTVDRILGKLREHIESGVLEGNIPTGSNLVQSAICISSEDNTQTDWVLDDGKVFTTRSNRRDFERPLAPTIPSAVKKTLDLMGNDDKVMDKARASIRTMILGAFAVLETRLMRQNPQRTLPGVSGKTYSTNREVAEYQKYADANSKVGL